MGLLQCYGGGQYEVEVCEVLCDGEGYWLI